MTAKEYLSQLWELDRKIQQRTHQVEELKLLAMGTGSIGDGERVQTSTAGDQLSASVARYVDLQRDIEQMTYRYVEKKTELVSQSMEVRDDRYETILFMRYAQGMPLREVADKMGYAYKHVSRLHSQALKQFESICLVG